jgi:polyvinyl alcohol dehydrogenase (cytochrome)
MYLHDPAHSSFDPNESLLNPKNVGGLVPLWQTSLGGTISTGVTVSNGVLFFGAWDGNFHAVDASTGAILWLRYLGKAPDPDNPACGPGIGIASQATISGDIIYAAGGDSSVYALNRYTGEIQWRVPLADPQTGAFLWSSVLLSGNALYVGIASLADCPLVRGGVARIPLDNPTRPLIRYLVPQEVAGASVWSTPAIDEQANLLYITTGNADGDVQDATEGIWGSALLALDATTLEMRAYFFLPLQPGAYDADWGSSPLLFETPDGSPFVAANGKNGAMWVLHRPDLTPAWGTQLAIDCIAPEFGCGSLSTPAFDGRTLFTGAGASDLYPGYDGSIYAFDAAGTELLWSRPSEGVVIAPVTVTPGLVYVPTTQGMAILDAATGDELWSDWGSAGLYGQAVVADGRVYSTYNNGDLIAWSLMDGSAQPAGKGAARPTVRPTGHRPPGPGLLRRGPPRRSDPGPASPPQ